MGIGLDAHASLDLVMMLKGVAKSGRLVIMSIHQPRLEIFQQFDRILFMSSGQVSRIQHYYIACNTGLARVDTNSLLSRIPLCLYQFL